MPPPPSNLFAPRANLAELGTPSRPPRCSAHTPPRPPAETKSYPPPSALAGIAPIRHPAAALSEPAPFSRALNQDRQSATSSTARERPTCSKRKRRSRHASLRASCPPACAPKTQISGIATLRPRAGAVGLPLRTSTAQRSRIRFVIACAALGGPPKGCDTKPPADLARA